MLYIRHMIRTQVYLPKPLYDNISSVAKKEQKAAAQIIRELLEEGVTKKSRGANAGKALLNLSKLGMRGPKDLSTNLDQYMYGR